MIPNFNKLVADFDLSRANPAYYEADCIVWWITRGGLSLYECVQLAYLDDYVYRRAVAAQFDSNI